MTPVSGRVRFGTVIFTCNGRHCGDPASTYNFAVAFNADRMRPSYAELKTTAKGKHRWTAAVPTKHLKDGSQPPLRTPRDQSQFTHVKDNANDAGKTQFI